MGAGPANTKQQDVTGIVLDLIATSQRVPPEQVSLGSTFEELKMDSLDAINLIFAVEEKFDISIPDDAAKSIRTVREMVDGVERLIQQKSLK
jgi:acyl carrier protein